MDGVPSALIARNESWVRQQAQALVRHLPANVEKADLIQVGLIAVAQAALTFEWAGDDRESDDAEQAFVKYARHRVRGAMLDELRQMDHLGRAQRRKVKVVQIARERWRAIHGKEPSLAELAPLCGMQIDEIARLDQADKFGRQQASGSDGDEAMLDHLHPATPKEEVEARVDTGIVMRHLERFFAQLPERERRVIDAYLGVGLTPVQLAQELNVSPSRVSQMYKSLLDKLARHFGHHRSTDRVPEAAQTQFDELVAQREAELETLAEAGPWGEMMEEVLNMPRERFGDTTPDVRLQVTSTTRWG
jgi:RNA polymerase sigma factor for flagellar operon FliA